MRFSVYCHCSGVDHVPSDVQDEVGSVIRSVKVTPRMGAASSIRNAILEGLIDKGWSGPVLISPDSEMTITSMKAHVGLCLQTGNMARLYADILKLQKLYAERSIIAAIFIVPSQPLAKAIGDNVAHASRLGRELTIFSGVIDVPILVYGLE